jgi:hypothetical protein
MSLCIQEDGICASTQGLLAAFHSHAMVTLATFLHAVTNVVIRSGLFKFGIAASTISEFGIRFNVWLLCICICGCFVFVFFCLRKM